MNYLLTFNDRKLEESFVSGYNVRTLKGMRLGFWLATLLYAVFGILDVIMMPYSYNKMWFIRFCVVIPLNVALFMLTYITSLRRYNQIIMSFNAAVMGLGIIAMIMLSGDSEPGYWYYYSGLMLVIMGINSIFRLRFYYALASSVIIILGYEFAAVIILKVWAENFATGGNNIFIGSNFFFLSSAVIGLMAAYYLEYSMRVEFIQQIEISEKHGRIESLMNYMNQELVLAKHIQMRLLPDVCPYVKDLKIDALYRPMEMLGGDFFDYVRFLEKNLLGIFISDVSGHGIPAALITSMLKSLAMTSGSSKFNPSLFLRHINLHLSGQIEHNFVTAVYMLYDSETRKLKYARAGHPFPLLVRNGEVIQLKSSGGIIGLVSEAEFEEDEIQLEAGDKIILYTDGLTEEMDYRRKMFEETFFSVVLPELVMKPVEIVIPEMFRKLTEYKGDDNLSDDVCLLGLEII